MIAAEVLEGNNTYWFRSVTFSPDGRQLSSSSDRTIRIWDAETGVLQKTLDGHTGLVGSVTFSPDGRQLVSARSEERRVGRECSSGGAGSGRAERELKRDRARPI